MAVGGEAAQVLVAHLVGHGGHAFSRLEQVERGNVLPRAGEIPAAILAAGLQQVQALGRLAFPLGPVWVYQGRRPERADADVPCA